MPGPAWATGSERTSAKGTMAPSKSHTWMTSQEEPMEHSAEKKDQKRKNKKHEIDRELDKALEETFPGSDPVSVSQPVADSDEQHRK